MSERKMPSVEDYPSNATTAVQTREKVKPIVRGNVKKKSSIFRSMKDEFISEDADSMGSYLLYDILFPALRDLVNDICHGAIDAAFGGGGRSSYRRSGRNRGSYISYNRYYDDDDRDRRRRRNRDDDGFDRRRVSDYQTYSFELRQDAEDVLEDMCDYLENYHEVPVSYFYDLTGESIPGDSVSDDWGWTNLAGTKVRRMGRRYIIDFPRIRQL